MRTNPYTPNFKRIPASKTEPIVGASTWASGSQMWKGNNGILDAKDKKKVNQSQYCSVKVKIINTLN